MNNIQNFKNFLLGFSVTIALGLFLTSGKPLILGANFQNFLAQVSTKVGVFYPSPLNIDISGNVGVGTITPSSKLEVAGHITQSACRTGETLVVNGLCIDNSANSIANFFNASIGCSVKGGRVCTYSDLITACNFRAKTMSQIFQKWIGNVLSNNRVLMGNSTTGSCVSNFVIQENVDNFHQYFCCYGATAGAS